ncbi:MAG: type II secretion system F family protein [Acidimicrobiia bacterium]
MEAPPVRIVAALFGAGAVYLTVALVLGVAPNVAVPSRSRPQISKRQLWLIQAGSDLTPRQFRLGSVAGGLVTFGVLLFVTQSAVIAAVPAVAAGFLPSVWYARRRQRLIVEVQAAWPDGIRDVLAHVTSGATLGRAVEALAADGPLPLRRAFARFPLQARMFGVVAALEIVKEELSDPTSDKVVEVLILAHEFGGDLVQEVLRDLIDTITGDLRTLAEIRTAGFEQRVEGLLVVVVPWVVLVFLATVPADYRAFYRTATGQLVVLIGALWTGFGVVVMRLVSRGRGEPRVLGGGATVSGGR